MTIFFIILLAISALYTIAVFPRLSRRDDMKQLNHTMFAHRGYHCAEKLIPENSMAAFKAAVSRGYGIELDVHITKDGQVAVFHDDTLERMCHTAGAVEDFTLEDLQKLHLLNTSEKIPLLSDVLAYVDGRVPLLIELKLPTDSTAVCPATHDALKNYNGVCLIQSFNTMGLRWFRKYAPEVLRGQLSSNLVADSSKHPAVLRFSVKHLLCNFLGRPDFISYKLKDLPNLGVSFCKNICKTPIAVWTLRTENALKEGKNGYNMQIFEKKAEFY